MTDTVTLFVILGGVFVLVCGFAAVLGGIMFFLIRRNAGQAKAVSNELQTLAHKHGFTFEPGDLMRSPSLSGVLDGQTVTLTYGSYRMGSDGMSYRYTQALAGTADQADVLIADRRRQHHVAPVSGPEVPISDAAFASTHLAKGQPAVRVEALIAPAFIGRYQQQAISHVRLAGGQLLVQRPGHHRVESDCLGLMQLAADLARTRS